jgi:hypothetical protein
MCQGHLNRSKAFTAWFDVGGGKSPRKSGCVKSTNHVLCGKDRFPHTARIRLNTLVLHSVQTISMVSITASAAAWLRLRVPRRRGRGQALRKHASSATATCAPKRDRPRSTHLGTRLLPPHQPWHCGIKMTIRVVKNATGQKALRIVRRTSQLTYGANRSSRFQRDCRAAELQAPVQQTLR